MTLVPSDVARGARPQKLRRFGGSLGKTGLKTFELARGHVTERLDRLPERILSFWWKLGQRLEGEPTCHFHLDQGLELALVEIVAWDTQGVPQSGPIKPAEPTDHTPICRINSLVPVCERYAFEAGQCEGVAIGRPMG